MSVFCEQCGEWVDECEHQSGMVARLVQGLDRTDNEPYPVLDMQRGNECAELRSVNVPHGAYRLPELS